MCFENLSISLFLTLTFFFNFNFNFNSRSSEQNLTKEKQVLWCINYTILLKKKKRMNWKEILKYAICWHEL